MNEIVRSRFNSEKPRSRTARAALVAILCSSSPDAGGARSRHSETMCSLDGAELTFTERVDRSAAPAADEIEQLADGSLEHIKSRERKNTSNGGGNAEEVMAGSSRNVRYSSASGRSAR